MQKKNGKILDDLLIQKVINSLELLVMNNLEDKIRNVIKEALCSEYIGNLDILHDEDSYTLKLDLNQHEAPMYFSYQGSEEGFLDYLLRDLRQRQIDRAKYYKGIMTDTGNDDIYYIVLE